MLRSFRALLVMLLVTLSLPVLRCGGAAPVQGEQIPIKVEVKVQPLSTGGAPALSLPDAMAAAPDTPVPSPSDSPLPSPTVPPSPTPLPTPFSLFWVSDTQVYAYKYPKVYNKIFSYMVNEREKQNALGILMTGDLVDNRHEQRHWDNAKAALSLAEGKLPLWCVAGNHDVGANTVEYETYLSYDFCAAKAEGQLYRQGVCWYDTLSAGGEKLLLLGIGWQTDSDYMAWAEGVLQQHPDHQVILLVHSFLTDKGSLTANGKKLEGNLLSVYPNIRLVLCGHNDGSVRWEKTYPDGHTVNALMYNFQDDKKYGLGYLRILTFQPEDHSLYVTTYSPWFEDYNYFKDASKDTFTLENAW